MAWESLLSHHSSTLSRCRRSHDTPEGNRSNWRDWLAITEVAIASSSQLLHHLKYSRFAGPDRRSASSQPASLLFAPDSPLCAHESASRSALPGALGANSHTTSKHPDTPAACSSLELHCLVISHPFHTRFAAADVMKEAMREQVERVNPAGAHFTARERRVAPKRYGLVARGFTRGIGGSWPWPTDLQPGSVLPRRRRGTRGCSLL